MPVDFEDFNKIKEKLEFCEKLGIKNVILEPKNNVKKMPINIKKKIENDININIFFRLNLRPKNLIEFKKSVKNFNNFPHILSVETSNKKIQIAAASDSRVDLISFSNQNILRTLTPGVISLTKQNNSFIEFSLAPMMANVKSVQSKNSRILYRFIQLAMKKKANFIINGNFDDIYDIRHQRCLVSICHTLLQMPIAEAKKSFKDNLIQLLKRVQNRQNKTAFEPGVKLVS